MSEVHQPLHPDYIARLDPEYVAFHNAHVVNIIPLHTIPFDPEVRNAPTVPGTSELVKVGNTQDYTIPTCKVRVFTPEGDAPAAGWPVFIWFHGGGWTLGSISSDNSFCTRQCKFAQCVVVNVAYRLAPEDPYPAAVEDAVAALEWVHKEGASTLNVDVNRIAVGGSSSGGNLAAILSLKAAELQPAIPLVFQLLVVPVTDNTASTSGEPYASWLENADTPWLNIGRMLWFRNNYLPNKEDLTKWDNSPIFAPKELLAKTPPAWIGVTELDILRDEGIAYAEKLKNVGVEVSYKVYPKAPHPIMSMDAYVRVLAVGKELVSDCIAVLSKAFGTS